MSVDKFGRGRFIKTGSDVIHRSLVKMNIDKVSKSGDTMTGNLRLSIGNDNNRAFGCSDLNPGNKFKLIMGNRENQINFSPNRPITVDSTDGFLVKIGNERVCQIGTNTRLSAEPVLLLKKSIWMDGNKIIELPSPVFQDEAVNKRYVDDNLSRKILNGYIPTLNSLQSTTTDFKSGFTVTASSYVGNYFLPMNVFNNVSAPGLGNGGEWRVANDDTTNFWICVRCPEPVRVWRIALRGRESNTGRIFHWMLEGSTNGQDFNRIFEAPNPTHIGNTVQFFPVNTSDKFNYYRLYCYEAESQTGDPGLSYMQLYIYSE